MSGWRRARLGCLVLLGLWHGAGTTTTPAQERAELAQQRRMLLEALAQEERECRERFAVTACQDDVRRRRRDALQPLREREHRLEEAERRARAAERRAAVAARQASAPRAAPAASEPVMRVRPERPERPEKLERPERTERRSRTTRAPDEVASAPPRRAAAAASEARAAAREEAAAERARAAERRQAEAEATRARIEQRQAQREASGRRAQPLPPPATAASGAKN